jgi:hypothetical protein
MRRCSPTVDSLVLVGALAGIGPGYTLEAVAVRLAKDIAELRDDGGIPLHVRTEVTVLPHQRLLEIRVDGLSVDADPDRTTIREVMNTLFELASYHNVVALDGSQPPLFTQRILILDTDGRPFAALVGAAVGDVEPLPSPVRSLLIGAVPLRNLVTPL